MAWDVVFTDDFGKWDEVTPDEQESVDFSVGLLIEYGPDLRYPHSLAELKSEKEKEKR